MDNKEWERRKVRELLKIERRIKLNSQVSIVNIIKGLNKILNDGDREKNKDQEGKRTNNLE